MRLALIAILVASTPAFAQDLPDPGRRLTKEEQQADPAKRAERALPVRRNGPRDPAACERARTNYTLSCHAPDSNSSRSMLCAEAYALYRQSCD